MSGDSLQVKIEFGQYHLVIDGFHTPVEAADFAADLMQKLSEGKSLEELQEILEFAEEPVEGLSTDAEPPKEAPLLLGDPTPSETVALAEEPDEPESAPTPEVQAAPEPAQEPEAVNTPEPEPEPHPQFVSKRRVAAPAEPVPTDDSWLAEIARLERAVNQAIESLLSRETPVADASEPEQAPARDTADIQKAINDAIAGSVAAEEEFQEPVDVSDIEPEEMIEDADAFFDEFAPLEVANASKGPTYDDLMDENFDDPAEAEEDVYFTDDIEIIDAPRLDMGMDMSELRPLRDENSAAHARLRDETMHSAVNKAQVERLFQTTKAMLEDEDHLSKARALQRLKAAVAQTEAERRIKVRTGKGTVTLDFDAAAQRPAKGPALLPETDTDPFQRVEKIRNYRKIIDERKQGD